MIVIDGYSIQEYPKQNMLVIGLPQTMDTATSTRGYISNRRSVLSENELAQILTLAKSFFDLEQIKNNDNCE